MIKNITSISVFVAPDLWDEYVRTNLSSLLIDSSLKWYDLHFSMQYGGNITVCIDTQNQRAFKDWLKGFQERLDAFKSYKAKITKIQNNEVNTFERIFLPIPQFQMLFNLFTRTKYYYFESYRTLEPMYKFESNVSKSLIENFMDLGFDEDGLMSILFYLTYIFYCAIDKESTFFDSFDFLPADNLINLECDHILMSKDIKAMIDDHLQQESNWITDLRSNFIEAIDLVCYKNNFMTDFSRLEKIKQEYIIKFFTQMMIEKLSLNQHHMSHVIDMLRISDRTSYASEIIT